MLITATPYALYFLTLCIPRQAIKHIYIELHTKTKIMVLDPRIKSHTTLNFQIDKNKQEYRILNFKEKKN